MNLWSELLIIVLLTMANGVFTGAEIAMLSVRKTRLQELAEGGNRSARAALRLRRIPERLLATIQVAITVIGATTAVLGGARLEEPLAAFFSSVGFGDWSNAFAFVLVIGLVSYLSLVIGELVPKSLALRSPERYALRVAYPLSWLSTVGRPFVWLLTASSNLVLKPFRDTTTFSESRLSPDELQQLLEESAVAGVLHQDAGDIASRAIELPKIKAKAVMVPRAKIKSIEVNASDDAILEILRLVPHTRYPVYEGDEEKVLGYVLASELYRGLVDKSLDLRALVRPVSFFPESSLAIDVLRALQKHRRQLGLLVEEQGGLAGLITVEDIAEEVLGDILEEDEIPRLLMWRSRNDNTLSAFGDAPVHEVSRELEIELGDGDASVATIGGLVLAAFGRVPAVGERVGLSARVEAEVVAANARQVQQVRLRVLDPTHSLVEDEAATETS